MGARNLAAGIATGVLMYRGERRAAGIMFCTASIIGPVDAWACWSAAGKMTSEAWGHVIANALSTAAGLWMAMG